MSETRVTPEMVAAAHAVYVARRPGNYDPDLVREMLEMSEAVRSARVDTLGHIKAGDPAPAELKGGCPVSIGFSIPFMCSRESGHGGEHIFAASGVVVFVTGTTP